MLGRVDNNCEIDTIAGPVPGLVQKPEYCLDHNYEVVLTNGGCGTGFVGVSGECQINFNPHCCVGLDENLCPIYKGVLTVDKVVAGEYEGVDANKINACPTTDNIDINIALVSPEDLDNMNSILYGCGHAISYNPGTGVMKVTEIDAETCDLSLGGGTAIVCSDCRLHTCLAGTISCDTVYEPLACCTGVSSGETLNATAINCDGKLIKMSCVEYSESPSGYDFPLYSKVIPATSLTTNTAINTPFIYNDELSLSANCNITLGICPTCDSQCNWVTGSYVSLTNNHPYNCLSLYSDHTTTLKAGRQLIIQAGYGNKCCPVYGGGFATIDVSTYCLRECTHQIVECACTLSTNVTSHSYDTNSVGICVRCCAIACIVSACCRFNCLSTYAARNYSLHSCGPLGVYGDCNIQLCSPELHMSGTFTIGDFVSNCCATITSTGLGTFKGICVYGGEDVSISEGGLEIYSNGYNTAEITSDGDICGQCLIAACGYEFDDWSDVDYVPNAGQIEKHVKTNGINDVVVLCAPECTYDSPLVDGHVYYLCFVGSMTAPDDDTPMAITYNWSPRQGVNCSKTYNLQYTNAECMLEIYCGYNKGTGVTRYVDPMVGFFVTPHQSLLEVAGPAMVGRDSTDTCEYWLGRGWRSAVSQVQQAFDKARPVGSTYTQFPGTDDPNTLFNDDDITSVWTELDFGGAFFRANGGVAKGFNCGVQPESIGPHCHCTESINMNHTHDVGTYRVWGDDSLGWNNADGSHNVYLINNMNRRSGGFQGREEWPTTWAYRPDNPVAIETYVDSGICLNAYCGHGFEGRSGEAGGYVSFSTTSTIYPQQPAPDTHPYNYTVKIWKRTA